MNPENHSQKGGIVNAASGFTTYARNRATSVTVVFGVIALISLSSVVDWAKSWPLVLFYAMLLVNTYFSVRSFASITPKENIGQQIIDVVLFLSLFLMVMNFNSILNFIIWARLLFIVATIKYIFLVRLTGYSKLLYMKIRIDALGILFCFLALIGALLGYGKQVSAIWAITFVLANIYVLKFKPHYLLEHHYENEK